MLRERTAWALGIAAVAIVVAGLVKPDSPDPLDNVATEQTRFFLHKTLGVTGVPNIILGDSRALRGLSPGEIDARAGLGPILNFAYESGGMDDEMYDAVEKRLAPSGPRTVILAITPLAFMPWKVGNDQYREYLDTPDDSRLLYMQAPSVAEFLESRPPSVLVRLAFREAPKVMVRQEFHPDGWIETDQSPSTAALETERAPGRLAGNRVSPELIDAFMDRTRAWTDRGIRVFGLRPPSSAAMQAIEDTTLGFEDGAFVARFTAAGGVWLDPDVPGLVPYDGSHLGSEDARRYSRAVGEAIAAANAAP